MTTKSIPGPMSFSGQGAPLYSFTGRAAEWTFRAASRALAKWLRPPRAGKERRLANGEGDIDVVRQEMAGIEIDAEMRARVRKSAARGHDKSS